MPRCETCQGVGEVLIDKDLNIVWRLEQAVLLISCPAGCIGGIASCCDGVCGGPGEITNRGENRAIG